MTSNKQSANAEFLQRYAAFVRAYMASGPADRTAVSSEYGRSKTQLTAEFTSDLAVEAAEMLATIAPVVSQIVGDHERPNDGPVSPDGFRYQGEVYRGLQPKPWRLLDFLWAQPNRAADLDDAVAHVMDDQVYEDEPHGWRKRLNIFFRKYRLPFHATIRRRAKQAAIIDGLPATAQTNCRSRKEKPVQRP